MSRDSRRKEDIASGCAAAINGGVTGVVMMPNTSPALDSAAVVRSVLDKAARVAPIQVLHLRLHHEGARGQGAGRDRRDAPARRADAHRRRRSGGRSGGAAAGDAVCERVRDVLRQPLRGAGTGRPAGAQRGAGELPARDQGSPGLLARRSAWTATSGWRTRPGRTCTSSTSRPRSGTETIRWWKERGARVTAEVSPHHLLFRDEDIGDFDTHYKMNPPLRTREDNEALLQGLKDGVFDLIATDHAPHTPFEKAQDFVSAPNGITGLETALVSLHHHFVAEGKFGWDLMVKRYSAEPRRMMGLDPVPVEEGKPAEFLLFDPDGETTFSAGVHAVEERATRRSSTRR